MYIEKYEKNQWEIVQVISIKDDEDEDAYHKRSIKHYDKWRCRPEAHTGIRLVNDANQVFRLCHD